MRLLFSMAAAAVLAVLALAACNATDTNDKKPGGKVVTTTAPAAPTAAPQAPVDNVRRVTTAEASRAVQSGTAIILDVRPATSYQASHIKGSINIPVEEVANRMGELPRDKMIVAYCS